MLVWGQKPHCLGANEWEAVWSFPKLGNGRSKGTARQGGKLRGQLFLDEKALAPLKAEGRQRLHYKEIISGLIWINGMLRDKSTGQAFKILVLGPK